MSLQSFWYMTLVVGNRVFVVKRGLKSSSCVLCFGEHQSMSVNSVRCALWTHFTQNPGHINLYHSQHHCQEIFGGGWPRGCQWWQSCYGQPPAWIVLGQDGDHLSRPTSAVWAFHHGLRWTSTIPNPPPCMQMQSALLNNDQRGGRGDYRMP